MSKGLEALQDIRLRLFIESEVQSKKVINDLKTIEKELKALEIIKNKKVDIKYLYYRANFNLDKYNDNYIETLTQEEIDLLKEVLKK